ncbi:MAG: hypothetical protein E7256_03785 [Lachnospiraceae bacterium]|nr:hypothetical protein [Lachnospiraceae bacterium]
MFKKYGRLFFLVILLLVLTELNYIVNRQIDNSLESSNNQKYSDLLDDAPETQEALEKGLNGNTPVWVIELNLLRDDYPSKDETVYQYVSMSDWQNKINALITEINAEYVSDEDILAKVRDIVPDELENDVFDDYFQAIAKKVPDIFKES